MTTLSDRPHTALVVIDVQQGVVAEAPRRDQVVAHGVRGPLAGALSLLAMTLALLDKRGDASVNSATFFTTSKIWACGPAVSRAVSPPRGGSPCPTR